jgi:hypothetical protein
MRIQHGHERPLLFGFVHQVQHVPRVAAESVEPRIDELTTVDRFCEERRLEHVDFLKIDVEGFERDVLEGASNMLGAGKIRYVQLEFNAMNLLSRTTMDDIKALLPGYRNHRLLYDGGLLPIDKLSPLRRKSVRVSKHCRC